MDIKTKLKTIISEGMNLPDLLDGNFSDDSALFGAEGLGLDSLDAVELVILIKKHFGAEIQDPEESRAIFASVNSLAAYLEKRCPE